MFLSNGKDFGFLSFKLPVPTVSLHLGSCLKGECMNQKAKPHKHSLVVEDRVIRDHKGFGSVRPCLGGVRVQWINVNSFILWLD